jgi:demethylmenaquinone methyltransferase / 2-methoxy-6-polyprenyl-1,4-benzoquinol methylase
MKTMEKPAFVAYNTDLFRKVAPFYDLLVRPVAGVRKAFVDFVAPRPGARVLDVATGTGKQALAFAARGFDTTGVDLSPHMLEVAQRKNPYPHARFKVADGAVLPFADGSKDITVMSFALHCMPEDVRAQVVAEMRRVTRPAHPSNGCIAFIDYGLPDSQPARWLAYRFISAYETPLWRQYIRSDFEALLRRQGLQIVQRNSLCFGAIRMWKCVPAVVRKNFMPEKLPLPNHGERGKSTELGS